MRLRYVRARMSSALTSSHWEGFVPITISQLKDRLEASLVGVDRSDSGSLQAKIGEFMEYSVEQYDQLDAEAKAYIDNVFHALQNAAKALADALPEGPEKRRTMRQLSLAGGGHFQAEHLIEIFEAPRRAYTSDYACGP